MNNQSQRIESSISGSFARVEREFECRIITDSQPETVTEIMHAIPEYFSYEPTIEWYCCESLKPSSTTIVVSSKVGKPVGFVILSSVNDSTSEVVVMAVLPEYQRRGLGAKLLKSAEKQALWKNKQFMMVKTIGPSQSDKKGAQSFAFFRKHGYAMLAEYDFLWQNYYCAIMAKRLDAEPVLPIAKGEIRDTPIANFRIEEQKSNQDKLVSRVLNALPDYFHFESAINNYCEIAKDIHYTTYAAVMKNGEKAGFATLVMNSETTAEIWIMGVLPEFHRQGVGSALLETVHEECRKSGRQYIMVRTIGPRENDPFYLKTLTFYRKNGYEMLAEFDDIWQDFSCAMMLKKIS